ncbi:MAG TPA: hypothetical protein DCZ20_04710 [Lachnospiraceae bacterium]|nr:hypothetical protein [Lachnospiraceae bacterium]
MDSIVKKLSEIDQAAAAIVEHAQEQKPVLEKEIQEARNRFDEELEQETQKRLKEIEDGLKKEMDEVLFKQQQESDAHMKALTASFEKDHRAYADEILKRMTEV